MEFKNVPQNLSYYSNVMMLYMEKQKVNFRCDLCGYSKFKIRYKFNKRLLLENKPYDVVQCKNCKLVRLHPLPKTDEFEDIYYNYSEKKKRIRVEKIRLKNVYPNKLKTLKKYSPGKRLLDIGAGLGTFVYVAEKAGFNAVGVEYEKNQCKKAKELWDVDLIQGMIEEHYKQLGKFDAINLHHVLEHVHSPKEILRIIHELLDENGICLIEVPNQFFNINKEYRAELTGKNLTPDNSLHHLTFFSVRTLKRYINEMPFEILELNQFRGLADKGSFFKRISRSLYRKFIDMTELSGGGFIEIYLRKK